MWQTNLKLQCLISTRVSRCTNVFGWASKQSPGGDARFCRSASLLCALRRWGLIEIRWPNFKLVKVYRGCGPVPMRLALSLSLLLGNQPVTACTDKAVKLLVCVASGGQSWHCDGRHSLLAASHGGYLRRTMTWRAPCAVGGIWMVNAASKQ